MKPCLPPDAPLTLEDLEAGNTALYKHIESSWLYQTGMRLDAGYYNTEVSDAHQRLVSSGLNMQRLGDVTDRIFIPPRFKRIYVDSEHGVPFLQGSHLPHFKPADLKYLSLSAHKDLSPWAIQAGWVLVTRSGTIGRVALALEQWDGWIASEHIIRIVPRVDSPCPAGYIYSWLSSPCGQAQFNGVYGAVVDEITAEHVENILIPVPETPEQQVIVRSINGQVLEGMSAKERALELDASAIESVDALVSLNSPPA